MHASLRAVTDSLLSVVLAPPCAACAKVLDTPCAGPVCASCWAAISPLGPHAGAAATGAVARWQAAGEHEGALRAIVHAFKYEERRSLASPLGRLMREAGRDVLADAACVVPVPLHAWRRFRRGFNQALLLARELERPVLPALWRIRRTASQTGLDRSARERNVRSAFGLSPLVSSHARTSLLAGQVVVLVDDVRTTGATLDACALVLRAAGAREVRALTVGARLGA